MKYRVKSIFAFFLVFCCIMSGCAQKNADAPKALNQSETTAGALSAPGRVKSAADSSQALDQSQAVQERYTKISFPSTVLNKNMNVNIYLPEGYSKDKKYPVLYLIHGYTATEDTWMPDLEADKKADDLIKKNEIDPLIIVAPRVDDSYAINSAKVTGETGSPSDKYNTGMYEDYFCKELIPYIDKNYSTISGKEGRYLGGMSMGGWSALYLAFTHTDLFSKVGGHSPAIFLDGYPGSAMTFVYPTEELRNERDPLRLAQNKNLAGLKVYLDCGDQDGCTRGCDRLIAILKSKGVDSQYHLNKGDHDNAYWGANVESYLKFYAGK